MTKHVWLIIFSLHTNKEEARCLFSNVSLSLKRIFRHFTLFYFFATAFARNETQLWPNLANRAFILSTHKLSVPSIRMHCSCSYVCMYVCVRMSTFRFLNYLGCRFILQNIVHIVLCMNTYSNIYIHYCTCMFVYMCEGCAPTGDKNGKPPVCTCLLVFADLFHNNILPCTFFVWRLFTAHWSLVHSCVLFLFFSHIS